MTRHSRSAPSGLRLGLAETRITPPLGVAMAGYAARKGTAQGVHDDLYARALVVETDRPACALLSVSVCSLSQRVIDGVRTRAGEAIPIPPANLMIAATHTHSGPVCTHEYETELIEHCVECLATAWQRRVPGRLGVGRACVDEVARNRRRLEYGGLPIDPEVGIVKVEDADGRITGLLFNYACHATTMGPDNLLISEDWPGFAIHALRATLGPEAVVIFCNGAEGDINPGYNSGLSAVGAPIPIRTWAYAERNGTRLAKAILDVLPGIRPRADLIVRSRSTRVALPLRRTFPLTVLEAQRRVRAAQRALRQLESSDSGESPILRHRAEVDLFFAKMACNSAKRWAAGRRDDTVRVELQAIRLGDAALTSFPGEVFVEIGLAAKRRSPFSPTLIVGLANNGKTGGYLPTRETFGEGDYEILASDYAPEAGETLVAATRRLLCSLQ